ncbi:MAG: hypothetical protein DBY24_06165, partial [Prevotellaceae bacterium]
KYKAYILKYKALILKYMACIFHDKACVFSDVGKMLVLSLSKIEIQGRKIGRKRMPVKKELFLAEEQ